MDKLNIRSYKSTANIHADIKSHTIRQKINIKIDANTSIEVPINFQHLAFDEIPFADVQIISNEVDDKLFYGITQLTTIGMTINIINKAFQPKELILCYRLAPY